MQVVVFVVVKVLPSKFFSHCERGIS